MYIGLFCCYLVCCDLVWVFVCFLDLVVGIGNVACCFAGFFLLCAVIGLIVIAFVADLLVVV